jgi:hypothetical protein
MRRRLAGCNDCTGEPASHSAAGTHPQPRAAHAREYCRGPPAPRAPPLAGFRGPREFTLTVGRKFSKWVPSKRNHISGTDQANWAGHEHDQSRKSGATPPRCCGSGNEGGCSANRARNQVSESQEQSPAGVQTHQYPLYHRGGLLEAVLDGRQANDNEIDSDEA